MLSSRERLTREEWSRLRGPFRRARGTFYELRYYPTSSRKAAVIVSKKVAKTAVLRNRLRRQVYEGLRGFFRAKAPISGIYIVSALPAAREGARTLRQKELTQLLASLSTAKVE
jgi:ribonuclease P protein component